MAGSGSTVENSDTTGRRTARASFSQAADDVPILQETVINTGNLRSSFSSPVRNVEGNLMSTSPYRSGTPDVFSKNSPQSSSIEINVHNPDANTVEVVGRHLIGDNPTSILDNDDSLKLQGGDISREVYNWQREHAKESYKRRRSQSFSGRSSIEPLVNEGELHVHDIRIPGGFRRSFIHHKNAHAKINQQPPTFFTKNFIEFLTLYGHFAGEELDEDEEEGQEQESNENVDEESLLLNEERHTHKASSFKATLLLLKAFVGTGVLFLPKGFSNGGWLFASIALLLISLLSYWCFMLLINVRTTVNLSSYGDIGGKLYGDKMRLSILFSIVISQIGFAAAYIVFTATNLQAFTNSILDSKIGIELFIFIQLIVYLPLSLTRSISKLSSTALIADLFILLGLIYIYYYCSFVLIKNGVSDVKTFNNDWTLFIGTAIFTYEGIGLIIPIQESMAKPSKFPKILFWVLLGATIVFISIGGLGYLTFGTKTETVILLNFSNNIFVSIVQFLYSIAILLSTPIQLFPAIKILENWTFKKSGKFNVLIKWKKNLFRILIVLLTVLISWGGANDLDKFVALVGSLACVPLIYIYPPILHYKTTSNTFAKYTDLAICLLGFVMLIYTSSETIMNWLL